MKITVLLAAALLCVVCSSASYARFRTGHHHRHHFPDAGNMVGSRHTLQKMQRTNLQENLGCSDAIMRPCGGALSFEGPKHLKRLANHFGSDHFGITRARRMPPGLRRVMAEGAGRVVGGRPAGCPHAFCGCGASLHIFGKIVPALNLAANWLRFPRAEPAPGMVAVRRHHVFVLVRHIRGPWWIAHDSNSGRHLTRVHPRSIAGWAIVDPKGV